MDNTKIAPKRGKYLRKRYNAALGLAWGAVVLLVTFLLFFAGCWYLNVYGDTGFDSIVFTLTSSLGGVQGDLIWSFLLGALLPALGCTVLGTLALVVVSRKWGKQGRWISAGATAVLSISLLAYAAFATGLPEYLRGLIVESPIFEEKYVDPNSVEITFPEKKRNLIYIYLESMETTYFSKEEGGALEYNLTPELYELAQENLNFSHDKGVGGFLPVNGATWTIGAMVAHTAGVPLKTPPGLDDIQNGYGQDDAGFLPGITSITDILDREGYYQTLMVGSVASFGGRKQYFEQHGAEYIYELVTARRDGIVPGDYFVWWGMEDKYLFEYAKQELLEISQQEQPFAFSMLTVDTHHIGGYTCELCGDTYEESYENAIACSSRQVAEFVEWIQQQPFYENTTIIVTGDHLSMDNGYFERNVSDSYVRRSYNCFINAPVETTHNHNRQFSALDMFPTTLAALGCQIQGNRLGLGTNLFSDVPTLIESMGYSRFDNQLSLASDYYAKYFRLEEVEEDPQG